MFLEHNWLVKHNSEVNWKNKMIKFTRRLRSYMMKYQDVWFKTRKTQVMETTTQDKGEIGKELDKTNLEDLPEYI